MATTLLQIENEFYSSIRPKRVTRPDERPLHALRARGVEYVEVRCLDLDPFEPLGISGLTMAFLDAFLLHCLLSPDEPESPDKAARLARNVERTAATGRMPGLRLENGAGEVLLIDWAGELLAEVEPIADALDATHHDRRHREAIRIAHRAVAEPQLLPSARVMGAVAHDFGGAFTAFGVARSRSIKQHLLDSHTKTDDIGRVAAIAQPKLLVLSHLVPGDDPSKDTGEPPLRGPGGDFAHGAPGAMASALA